MSSFDRTKRLVLFVVVMSIAFAATFGCVFFIKSQGDRIKSKYAHTACDSMSTQYTEDQFLEHSIDSWREYYDHANHNHSQPETINSDIQCFCQKQLKELGSTKLSTQTYSFGSLVDIPVCK